MLNLPASKILVAEDNPLNQLIVTRLFESLGYSIDIAENGKQAVSMATTTSYHFIFMDVQMPEMNGLQAAEKIVAHYKFSTEAPIIIAMTANAMKEDEEECLAAGMNDFVSKPMFLETLKFTLKKWSSHREVAVR